MNKYLESAIERYVIATLDNPTTYLIFKDDNISFTKQIYRATKAIGRNTANSIKNEFYAYTNRNDIELVVLPIRISYEIIKEKESEAEGEYIELLS